MAAAAAAGAGAPAAGERTKNIAIMKLLIASAERAKGRDSTPDSVELTPEVTGFLKTMGDPTTHITRGDRRFPNVNQAANCWTAFNEFQLCVDKRGRDDAVCLQRGRDYSSICPEKWVEGWRDATAKGVSMSVGTAFLSDA